MRTQISIRTLNAITHCSQRFTSVHIPQLDSACQQIVDSIQKVIAGNDPDLEFATQAKLACHIAYRPGAAFHVHASCVSDNLDIPLDAGRQDLLHQRHEVSRVTALRIARLLLLHDRHRDFSQIVKHQIVNRAAFNLPHRRFGQVTPESLAGGDANLVLH